MDYLGAMRRRRTVRDVASRPVPRDIIETCIAAAGTAPSGANHQPWRFVAVADAQTKKAIRAAAEEEEQAFYGGRAPDEWLEALAPLNEVLGRPENERPFLLLVTGYPSPDAMVPRITKKPLSDIAAFVE
ncbi:MAG: nitroreductase family protein [Gemmatimonadota bacterium]